MDEQKFLNNQYCINCGISVKDLNGEYTEIVCPSCGVNSFGMGKQFREEITINYCENCGKEVKIGVRLFSLKPTILLNKYS